MKADRAAAFEHAARVDLCELVAIDLQYLGVAILGRTRRQPDLVVVVEDPTGKAVVIFPQKRFLAGRDADLIKVVPGLIAFVDPDIDRVRDRSAARRR